MNTVEMRPGEILFHVESFVEGAKSYKFDGKAICGCGRQILAILQASAFPPINKRSGAKNRGGLQ
jgi:hypothetical protein